MLVRSDGLYYLSLNLIGFLIFLPRHSDSLKSNGKNVLFTEEASVNIYPIMLRVSVTRGTNALTVKVSKKVCVIFQHYILLLLVLKKGFLVQLVYLRIFMFSRMKFLCNALEENCDILNFTFNMSGQFT